MVILVFGQHHHYLNLQLEMVIDGANGGLCLDASYPTVYNLKLYSFVQGGGQVGYNFQVNNQSSSVNAITLGYSGNVGIRTAAPSVNLDVWG
jgi:hypothetical protein